MLSLLNLHEPVGEIPAAVFTDISLDKLISAKEIALLSHICTPEDISARQAVFSLLEDKTFYEWLHELYVNLKYLDKSKFLFENASHEVERCALFCGCAESYVRVVECMANSYDAVFMAYLKDISASRASQIRKLKEGILAHKKLWEKISVSRLNFSPNGVYVNNLKNELTTISAKICEICRKLGYGTHEENKFSNIKMSPFLADALTKLYQAEFRQMAELRERLQPLINPDLLRFAGDLEFYFSMNRLRERAAARGIPACYPVISDAPKYVARDLCDVSLLLKDSAKIVPNDLEMTAGEHAFFIRGANGGGKTTFLRAAAINLIMFLNGCPVFAKSAEIYPFKHVFTHFPENEGFDSGGRLENEEKRLREVVNDAGNDYFMLLNETFTGADERKGTELSLNLMNNLTEQGAFALFVTHFHGVSEGKIPSLTTVVSGDDNKRTYKIIKQNSGRSSYAQDILGKYGLDRESLRRRLND